MGDLVGEHPVFAELEVRVAGDVAELLHLREHVDCQSDVFTQMKEFGDVAGDPYLEFCEDWMLADEVTHVKMGSDWLRKVTEKDPGRRAKALEFQQVVDKLFSFGGARGESDESPIGLARRFRELAGFTDDEVDIIAKMDHDALEERKAAVRLAQEAVGAVAAV